MGKHKHSKDRMFITASEMKNEWCGKKDPQHVPIAKLPFFAFFLITENLIAARGRGGGLALWIKDN